MAARAASLLLAACALQLVACAQLPAQVGQHPSVAVPDDGKTAFSRIVRASVAPGSDGFLLLEEPEDSLDARLALIAGAQRTLDLQYFIWNGDATGRALLAALRNAALRGVRVRLLLDDLNTASAEPLLKALSGFRNVEVRLFNPFPAGRSSLGGKVLASLADFRRIRHRMHNKLLVADNVMAVIGGRNIGDAYLSHTAGSFLDLDLLALGPMVADMSASFDDYWNSDQAYRGGLLWGDEGRESRRRSFDRLLAEDAPLPAPVTGAVARQMAGGLLHVQACRGRFFSDPVEKATGTDLEDASDTVHQRLLLLFSQAHREIFVVSPYFVRGPAGMLRLMKLHDRRVSVGVLTNSLGSTDEPFAHVVYTRYRRQLLRAGVHLREFIPSPATSADPANRSGPTRLHAKIAVVDQRFLYVGSLNFTSRSEHLNTEDGVILDCAPLARRALALARAIPAYRVTMAEPRGGLRWVDSRPGQEHVWTTEPVHTWWQKLETLLLQPFIPEDEI